MYCSLHTCNSFLTLFLVNIVYWNICNHFSTWLNKFSPHVIFAILYMQTVSPRHSYVNRDNLYLQYKIRPVLNSPSENELEGQSSENKKGANISLYSVFWFDLKCFLFLIWCITFVPNIIFIRRSCLPPIVKWIILNY